MQVSERHFVELGWELIRVDTAEVADLDGAFAVRDTSADCGQVSGGDADLVGLSGGAATVCETAVGLHDARFGVCFHGVETFAFDGTAHITVTQERNGGYAETLA
jgi:hypothetical protein